MKESASQDDSVGTYFDKAAHTFDSFYDHRRTRLMQAVDRRFRSDMFERFAIAFQLLEPLSGRTLLDVGCGSGPYLEEALRRGARHVVGVDMAPTMIDLARARIDRTRLSDRCDLRVGVFPDQAPAEASDYAVVMGVMDYVAEPERFLRTLARRVRDRAVLSFPSRHWFRTPLRRVRYTLKRCPVYFYDHDEIEDLLRRAGFAEARVVKIPGAGMDYVAVGSHGAAAAT